MTPRTLHGRLCTVDGCKSPELAKGFCNKHYKRWQTHGNPHTVLKPSVIRRGFTERSHFCVGDTGFIQLSNGSYALVDRDDYQEFIQHNWQCNGGGYASRWVSGEGNRTMQWFLMKPKSSDHIDHINRQRNDNRRKNLRSTTPQGNMFNKSIYRSNNSGHTGVAYLPSLGKWRARIGFQGTSYYLGVFNSKEEAILMYLDAKATLHKIANQSTVPDTSSAMTSFCQTVKTNKLLWNL